MKMLIKLVFEKSIIPKVVVPLEKNLFVWAMKALKKTELENLEVCCSFLLTATMLNHCE